MSAMHRLLAVLCGACVCAGAPNPLATLRSAESAATAELVEAAAAAPDEAVVVMQRGSARLVRVLADSGDPALRLLPELARGRCVPESVCPAAAVFYRQIHAGTMTREQAARIASHRADYFRQLVTLRMQGEDALFDRILHQEAETIRGAWMEGGEGRRSLALDRMAARDLYAILAYGQREESEVSFARFFDAEFGPRMSGGRLVVAIGEARGLRVRHFLVEAIRADRARELVAVAGGHAAALLAMAGGGAASEPEAALAAEIIEAYAGLAPTTALEKTLLREAAHGEAFAGLLAAWLERVCGGRVGQDVVTLAARYRSYLPDAAQLSAADACREGTCTQRLLFFDDDDGVASFGTFQAQYQKDARWSWEEHRAYVRAWRKGDAGLTVEVFANRPQSNGGAVSMAWQGREQEARDRFARATGGGNARIFVQRGHAYHVAKAIEMVPHEARLVYLGGCRGTENLRDVLNRAPDAQIVATRSTGTMDVNDPLLKAMSDELADRGRIDWDAFWARQRTRFAGGHLFGRYIPPHRNGAVLLMQAWRRYSVRAAGQ